MIVGFTVLLQLLAIVNFLASPPEIKLTGNFFLKKLNETIGYETEDDGEFCH